MRASARRHSRRVETPPRSDRATHESPDVVHLTLDVVALTFGAWSAEKMDAVAAALGPEIFDAACRRRWAMGRQPRAHVAAARRLILHALGIQVSEPVDVARDIETLRPWITAPDETGSERRDAPSV